MLRRVCSGLVLVVCLAVLSACGGADTTVTSVRCSGATDCSVLGPIVGAAFVQKVNNLEVTVDSGPTDLFSLNLTNILYATVTVCAPGARPTDGLLAKCKTIDHVQVDTGSVGLRVLASKVAGLGLIPVELAADASRAGLAGQAYECYPFVIGGLWGPTARADVRLGEQWASALTVQLIQDGPNAAALLPDDCSQWIDGPVLSSASALGSNGILGIGSTVLDCGLGCLDKNYPDSIHAQYYSCPPGASGTLDCSAAAVVAPMQVFNPVARLAPDPANNNLADNNGVVLVLPAVPDTGAAKVNGELIFGINTRSTDVGKRSISNQLAAGAKPIRLGVDRQNSLSAHGFDSYLNISTEYNGRTIYNSYLDTGTNGFFFYDSSIALCSTPDSGKPTWYCPLKSLFPSAVLSDGDSPGLNALTVSFLVRDSGTVLPSSTALPGMAGAPADPLTSAASFSWGLPFFYGKRVLLSIWDPDAADPLFSTSPWYSF